MKNNCRMGLPLMCLLLAVVVIAGQGCQKETVYVIGGYGWKALFMDENGFIATDGVDQVKTQYNLANELFGTDAQWVPYEAQQQDPKTYDCGGCHATGFAAAGEPLPTGFARTGTCKNCHGEIYTTFSESGHQFKLNVVDNGAPVYPAFAPGVPEAPEKFVFGSTPDDAELFGLPGFRGQWVEPNIGCEACHGPSEDHATSPAETKPPLENARAACKLCHITGPQFNGVEEADGVIAADGNLVLQRQEWEEWNASPHNSPGGPDCATCHNPHASTIYDDEAPGDGRRVYENEDCLGCHPGVAIGLGMDGLMCIDCHMPRAAKSAVSKGIIGKEGNYAYVGDIRSHQFKINAAAGSPNAFLNTERTAVKLDNDGKALGLTLNLVCQPCHSTGGITPHGLPPATPYTFDELEGFATQVHAAP